MSGEIGGSRLGNVIKAKEDLLKSPEQLEKEKREIISSRLVKINLDRLTKDDLVEEVKETNFLHLTFFFVFDNCFSNFFIGQKVSRHFAYVTHTNL